VTTLILSRVSKRGLEASLWEPSLGLLVGVRCAPVVEEPRRCSGADESSSWVALPWLVERVWLGALSRCQVADASWSHEQRSSPDPRQAAWVHRPPSERN
jgi:hypothetical protein